MSRRIRIGAVSYLNTRPLVYGLEQGLGADRLELSYAVPARLADAMASAELDIALLPVIELARMPELELVPGLGIVTQGPSRSVLLVSRGPVEEIASVALDPESRTSNVLSRVLLAEVWKRRPDFATGPADLDRALSHFDAAVRIGDKALFQPKIEGSLTHDLGQVWTEKTGLPFVFAVWAARPGVLDRGIYGVLHESRRLGSANLDRIVNEYTWNGRSFPEIARDYLTKRIRFRLGAAEMEAMRTFFGAAEAERLIDAAPALRLALQRFTKCHEAAGLSGPAAG